MDLKIVDQFLHNAKTINATAQLILFNKIINVSYVVITVLHAVAQKFAKYVMKDTL